MEQLHVFIKGRVQGVTFRASTKQKAEELGLDGWVRNLDDGRVEAVFQGDDEALEQIVEFCHHGPSPAEVENVGLTEEEPDDLDGFTIRR
ncbi:MAG: acylphosphatase [Candidatus Nanohaloarchaea archaeon]|nr:acylphosphatase [Candidatus Nanohaloarchaea archaeon]